MSSGSSLISLVVLDDIDIDSHFGLFIIYMFSRPTYMYTRKVVNISFNRFFCEA